MNSESESQGTQSTADSLLRSLTKAQRITYYSELCDYLRWLLKRQGHMKELERVEGIITRADSHFKKKVEAGEISADEANDIKSYKIWFLAHQESKGAPTRMAIWDAVEQLPKTESDYDRIFNERKTSIECEFAEKLKEYINLGEV